MNFVSTAVGLTGKPSFAKMKKHRKGFDLREALADETGTERYQQLIDIANLLLASL